MDKTNQSILDSDTSMSLLVTSEPPIEFVKLPALGGKLTWSATLTDFVALVMATYEIGFQLKKTEENKPELIAERYRSFIDVDYAGYSDFQAILQAYPQKVNLKWMGTKVWQAKKAHFVLSEAGPLIAFKHFAGFAVQAKYHNIVAEEFIKQWPILERIKISSLFDILFMPSKHIKAVLKGWRVIPQSRL